MTARRRPAAPWWLVADVVAAAVLFVIGLNEARLVGDDIFYRSLDALGVGLLLAQTAPVAFRRLAPITAVGIMVAAQAISVFADYPVTNALLGVPLALFTVAATRPRRTSVLVTIGALLVFTPAFADPDSQSLQTAVIGAVMFLAASFAGDGMQSRRLHAEALELRAERAEATRELSLREAVVAERTRLARELHDALGHTVNVLVMHAGAGRVASVNDPARAAQVLRDIEEIGRSALGDIDRMLGLLRDDMGESVGRSPAPTVDDVPDLVERLRGTGLDIELSMPHPVPTLPMTVGSAVYRIVQEALTNVVKHAGPARVQVHITISDGKVSIAVEDDGRGAAVQARIDPDRVGRGQIGMRERVVMVGGHLQVGPRAGGGYSVRAELPLTAQDRTSTSTPGATS